MDNSSLDILPDEILLRIFSHLSGEDIRLSICLVNRRWYFLTQDKLLWQQMLENDSHDWEYISNTSSPEMATRWLTKYYNQVNCPSTTEQSSLNKPVSSRDVYLYCRAQRNLSDMMTQHSSKLEYRWTDFLRSGLAKVASSRIVRFLSPSNSFSPKFSMIGPGLNSDKYSLMYEIFQGRGILKIIGAFPGSHQFPLSSGMSYELEITASERIHFDLCTLYSSYRQQRTTAFQEGEHILGPPLYDLPSTPGGAPRVSAELRSHLATQKGLIFVVDANMEGNLFYWAEMEMSLLGKVATTLHLPVLVLSLVMDVHSIRKRSALQISRLLGLADMLGNTVPWRVQDVICQGMWSLNQGMIWLHYHSRISSLMSNDN